MIGKVAAFTIDDLVKELRCMAARDMGSDEWKKCMELHEKFLDDVCQRCEYHHDGSPCGYDPGNPYDLCSLAADEIECCGDGPSGPKTESGRRWSISKI